MNSRLILLIAVVAGLLGGIAVERFMLAGGQEAAGDLDIEHARKHLDPTYVCPMHAEIVSKEPSSCPICGMDLVPVKEDETEIEDDGRPVVTISSTVMSNIGVRTAPVTRKTLTRRIEAPGFVTRIHKGKQSRFRSRVAGTVIALLFEEGQWYEPGAPLLELESQELLEAQQLHLELLAAAPEETTGDAEASSAPVDDESVSSENIEEADTDDVDEDEAGTALPMEQRQRLAEMGLSDEAIKEMESAMALSRQAQMSGTELSDAEKKAIADKISGLTGSEVSTDESVAAAASEDEPADDDAESEIDPDAETAQAKDDATEAALPATLEESRKRLLRLGMLQAAIDQLEESAEPSDKLILYAHHAGKIMDLSVSEGDEVEAGDLLFRLGGQVRVNVLANAFQRDAAWIKTGQRVEIRMPHVSGVVWPGVVNQGVVSINPNSQNIGIALAFTAPFDKVKANLYVIGTIFGTAREDVLAVPSDAVIRTEGEERVIRVLGDGRFQPVSVSTGITAGGEVEITAGLEAGDEIVTRAQFLIDSESSLKAGFRRLGGE